MLRKGASPRVLSQKEIEKLRDRPRALVAQPAVGWIHNESERHWIRIVDISETGMRILDLDTHPKVGSLVKVWWRLMAGLKEIELEGEVVWSRQGSCGLRLLNLGNKETHLLKQFVKFHRNEVSA